MIYYVYILHCHNEHYYTGYTNDIERRYREHCEGTAKSKFTRSFPPKALAACWEIEGTVSDALRLEYAIKKMTRRQKQKLIDTPTTEWEKVLHQLELTVPWRHAHAILIS